MIGEEKIGETIGEEETEEEMEGREDSGETDLDER